MRPPLSPVIPRVFLSMIVLFSFFGCGSTATISVLRPAQINAREFGGTMSVVPFGGHPDGARMVTLALVQRVRNADERFAIYVRNGGSLIIQGTVMDYEHAETVRQTPTACPRSTRTGGHASGRTCYTQERRITAFVTVLFEVVHRTSGERLVSVTLTDSESRTNRMIHTSVSTDGALMLQELTEGLMERFARVILPWREEVRIRFGRCGDASSHCEEGVQAMRAGNYRLAARAFRAAVRQLRRDGARGRNRPLAQANWNLGLAYEYAGDYERALRSIRRARRHDPRNDDYRRELRNIRRLEDDREELLRQGL